MGVTGHQGRPALRAVDLVVRTFGTSDVVAPGSAAQREDRTGVALGDLVNLVIVDEVGHRCGLSDDEMQVIGKDIR